MQDKEKDSAARIKKFMTMMDSMTNKELDSSDIKLWQTESRIMRIARGSGVHPNYVGELIGGPPPSASALERHSWARQAHYQTVLGGCLLAEQWPTRQSRHKIHLTLTVLRDASSVYSFGCLSKDVFALLRSSILPYPDLSQSMLQPSSADPLWE